ncbi:hypothetical protein CC2G_013235 [Coprinopsis cinerea AmutBmut pab1-1]|nr:hypothetical protein CC2G_013235 [Coprinopsis cinerea AmutBmut pab1-1]
MYNYTNYYKRFQLYIGRPETVQEASDRYDKELKHSHEHYYFCYSEKQIQAIKTVNDIKGVVGADAALLLVGECTPAICRLYATLVQEHERIIKEKFHLIGHYQGLDASVTKFFKATQKVLDGLNAQDQILEQSRLRVEAELLHCREERTLNQN